MNKKVEFVLIWLMLTVVAWFTDSDKTNPNHIIGAFVTGLIVTILFLIFIRIFDKVEPYIRKFFRRFQK